MNVVGLISGGKDSIFNLCYTSALGHSIVALAHLTPKGEQVETNSYMYQSVGSVVVTSIAECMQLPLVTREITGESIRTESLDYEHTYGDEVEDLYELLKKIKEMFPSINAISCGAIYSDYQRYRVENVANRLNLKVLAFLWKQNQSDLLKDMISLGIDAIIIKTATLGLNKKHIGKSISSLEQEFKKLNLQFGFHVCGEGGEYETLTLDAPIFAKRIIIDRWDLIVLTDDAWAPVLLLNPISWHTEIKDRESNLEKGFSRFLNLTMPNTELSLLEPFKSINFLFYYIPQSLRHYLQRHQSIFSDKTDTLCENFKLMDEIGECEISSLTCQSETDFWKSYLIHNLNSFQDLLLALNKISENSLESSLQEFVIQHTVICLGESISLNNVIEAKYFPSNFYSSTLSLFYLPNLDQKSTQVYIRYLKDSKEFQQKTFISSSSSISLHSAPQNLYGFRQINIFSNIASFSPFIGLVPHTALLPNHEELKRLFNSHHVSLGMQVIAQLFLSWRAVTNYLSESNINFESIPAFLVYVSTPKNGSIFNFYELHSLLHAISAFNYPSRSILPLFLFLEVQKLPLSALVQIQPFFYYYTEISNDKPEKFIWKEHKISIPNQIQTPRTQSSHSSIYDLLQSTRENNNHKLSDLKSLPTRLGNQYLNPIIFVHKMNLVLGFLQLNLNDYKESQTLIDSVYEFNQELFNALKHNDDKITEHFTENFTHYKLDITIYFKEISPTHQTRLTELFWKHIISSVLARLENSNYLFYVSTSFHGAQRLFPHSSCLLLFVLSYYI